MDETIKVRSGGESAAHRQLKRLALLWAQAQGYSACAIEVTLPRCRYRADAHDFASIGHRNYSRIIREMTALQNQLRDGTKFEKLVHYRCANLFFLVLPDELFRLSEIPVGWGALVEKGGILSLARQPVWHETRPENQLKFLHRIAITGTRQLNRKLGIAFEDVVAAQAQIAFSPP